MTNAQQKQKAKIVESMQILNKAYTPTPFHFTLVDTDYHINSSWHVDYSGDADYVYKSALRKGDYRTINSYTGDGDFMYDTPFELPIYENPDFEKMMCPADLDSGPDQPGLEPINNYMDYSKDECKSRFAPQQITRMIDHYKTFRQNWS